MNNKKFYAEAERMEKGWGKYLHSIDELKDKVKDWQDITLKEACWILYADGYCSDCWLQFEYFCKQKGMSRKKMVWQAWEGIFNNWLGDNYKL